MSETTSGDPNQNQYAPTQSQDVVGVFDQQFNQLFADARPIKANISPTAKLMRHPKETGGTITDNRIFEPIKITLNLIFKAETYVDMYQQVVAAFNSESALLVQTNVTLFQNMFIAQMPHEEDPSHYDTITMSLHLEECLFVTAQTAAAPSLPDTNKNRGNKTAAPATTTESSEGTTKAKSSVLYDGGHLAGIF